MFGGGDQADADTNGSDVEDATMHPNMFTDNDEATFSSWFE